MWGYEIRDSPGKFWFDNTSFKSGENYCYNSFKNHKLACSSQIFKCALLIEGTKGLIGSYCLNVWRNVQFGSFVTPLGMSWGHCKREWSCIFHVLWIGMIKSPSWCSQNFKSLQSYLSQTSPLEIISHTWECEAVRNLGRNPEEEVFLLMSRKVYLWSSKRKIERKVI